MTALRLNLEKVLNELDGSDARLVAVSKYNPAEAIKEAYDCGQRIFGESHAQELCSKQQSLPSDIEWHFIGHLQTNKVKYIAPFISLIHSVDSVKLMQEINRQAIMTERVIDCLLQVHIAEEETKYGFLPKELTEMLASGVWKDLEGIRITGLMCMATNTNDTYKIRNEFRTVRQLHKEIKERFFNNAPWFKELSMGMSNDYNIAVDEGSTLVRIGSKIFGERIYN